MPMLMISLQALTAILNTIKRKILNRKPDIAARHNIIYIKAWCSHDNPLGKAVPGTPNLLPNGIRGGVVSGTLRLVSMLFLYSMLLFNAILLFLKDHFWVKSFFALFLQASITFFIMATLRVLILGHSFLPHLHTSLLCILKPKLQKTLVCQVILSSHGMGLEGKLFLKLKIWS